MKFKFIKRIPLVGLCLWLCFTPIVFADVGNSFGGGSSSSGGGSSVGNYGGSSSSGGWEINTGDPLLDLAIEITIIGVFGVVALMKYQTQQTYQTPSIPPFNPRKEEEVIQTIQTHDTLFSAQAFKGYAQEVFLQVQEAWESRDMSVVRPLETDALFYRHQQQLQEYLEKDWVNHLDRQCIDAVHLAHCYRENDFEYLVVRLQASLVDYTTNAKGRVIQGSETLYQTRTYRLTFKRHVSVLTTTEQPLSAKACPNCGAPTNVGASGQCEFCGSVVTTGEHNWVLDNYEAWY